MIHPARSAGIAAYAYVGYMLEYSSHMTTATFPSIM